MSGKSLTGAALIAEITEALAPLQKIKEQYEVIQENVRQVLQNEKNKPATKYGKMSNVVALVIIMPVFAGFAQLIPVVGKYLSVIAWVALMTAGLKYMEYQTEKKYGQITLENEQLKRQNKELTNEMVETIFHGQEQIAILPEEYQYFDAAEYIKKALVNCRADQLDEACELYEKKAADSKKEAFQAKLLGEQQEQAKLISHLLELSKEQAQETASEWLEGLYKIEE
ncbi:hypothetical protein lbkm_0288 [Lachnospiraceae bacterium KM106-2]|nr:hypothetical protein lbkm_0288 [Lachnospiraceae bacterium KM106-2]